MENCSDSDVTFCSEFEKKLMVSTPLVNNQQSLESLECGQREDVNDLTPSTETATGLDGASNTFSTSRYKMQLRPFRYVNYSNRKKRLYKRKAYKKKFKLNYSFSQLSDIIGVSPNTSVIMQENVDGDDSQCTWKQLNIKNNTIELEDNSMPIINNDDSSKMVTATATNGNSTAEDINNVCCNMPDVFGTASGLEQCIGLNNTNLQSLNTGAIPKIPKIKKCKSAKRKLKRKKTTSTYSNVTIENTCNQTINSIAPNVFPITSESHSFGDQVPNRSQIVTRQVENTETEMLLQMESNVGNENKTKQARKLKFKKNRAKEELDMHLDYNLKMTENCRLQCLQVLTAKNELLNIRETTTESSVDLQLSKEEQLSNMSILLETSFKYEKEHEQDVVKLLLQID